MNLTISLYRIFIKNVNKSNFQEKNKIIQKVKNNIIDNKNLYGNQKDKAIDSLIFQIRMLNPPDRNFRFLP